MAVGYGAGPLALDAPVTPVLALNDIQRRLAQLLGGSPGAWQAGREWSQAAGLPFVNFSLLVRSYGLPGSHEDMQAYVRPA
jgi:hypothetical protein